MEEHWYRLAAGLGPQACNGLTWWYLGLPKGCLEDSLMALSSESPAASQSLTYLPCQPTPPWGSPDLHSCRCREQVLGSKDGQWGRKHLDIIYVTILAHRCLEPARLSALWGHRCSHQEIAFFWASCNVTEKGETVSALENHIWLDLKFKGMTFLRVREASTTRTIHLV